jgi:hypothetical protein
MTHLFQLRPPRRAPRVSLRGTIAITVQLENGRQLSARLQQLSITGGLLEVGSYLEERTRVGVILQIGDATVHPQAEMMFPMRGTHGYLQPFWFTCFRSEQRQALEKEITQLLKQTMTPGTTGHGLGPRPPRFYLESF